MGLFFQDREHKGSSKLLNGIRIVFVIGVFALLIIGLVNDFSFKYTGLAFILLGVTNIMNGAESHYYGEKKKVYITEYLFGFLLFTIAITYLR